MMDQNDQNDRFDRFDRFEPDFSRFESGSDRSERSSSRDRSERLARSNSRQPVRPVRSGMRMSKGKPMRRSSVKLNYRMVLCIAVLVLLLLTIIFGGLFKSLGSKIADLNSQIETLNKDKDNLSAQIGALTQENQTLQSSITATLPAAKTAETNSIVDLIPILNDGVYVVQSTGSQLRYISVPKGYLQDKLGEYRDDASGYAASTGDAPICQYYVLFTDRVIGLAEGDTGFVSTDRSATGSTSTIPSGFYDFVASFFNNSSTSTSGSSSSDSSISDNSDNSSDSSSESSASDNSSDSSASSASADANA